MEQFIIKIKNIDNSILKLMVRVFKICLYMCIIAIVLLLFYKYMYTYHVIYESGLLLFKNGLLIGVFSFICGFIIDNIRK